MSSPPLPPPTRPGMDARQSTSRPALRIRRLQPLSDGRVARTSEMLELPGPGASPHPRAHTHADTPRPAPHHLRAALEPGEVATVVRDARGAPALAAVPEAAVLHAARAAGADHAPDGPAAAALQHLDPHRSVPLPTDPPAVATEADNSASVMQRGRGLARRMWPLGGAKHPANDGAGGKPVVTHDYAADGRPPSGQYAEDIVDWLDVIDPEVATVSTLSNVQNSLFLPDLGNLYNRMPIIDLSRLGGRAERKQRHPHRMREDAHVSAFAPPPEVSADEKAAAKAERKAKRKAERKEVRRAEREAAGEDAHASPSVAGEDGASPDIWSAQSSPEVPRRARATQEPSWVSIGGAPSTPGSLPPPETRPPWRTSSRSSSASSTSSSSSGSSGEAEMRRRERLMRSRSTIRGEYAVLPAGYAWDDWTEDEKAELDDHVRHLMHSRRERMRRRLRGFWKFVSQPVGFLITLYAFLITFWGAAWVLFLIGWIYVGGRKAYFVEIADQILTALFCVVGIGMAPFRAVDTYHMIFIAHYHNLTWRLRRERNLPKLADPNDLPAPQALDPDLEAQFRREEEEPVLSAEQQRKLTYHQMKYHKSHTFYRPHETPTHYAFPLDLLIVITCLLDCHSLFQMALGSTTWGINYKVRPAALTATILSCSISCNITAGIIIAVGGRRTRKVAEVEKRLRQALTEEAMARMAEEKEREERERRGEPELSLSKSLSRRVDRVQAQLGGKDKDATTGSTTSRTPLTRAPSKGEVSGPTSSNGTANGAASPRKSPLSAEDDTANEPVADIVDKVVVPADLSKAA